MNQWPPAPWTASRVPGPVRTVLVAALLAAAVPLVTFAAPAGATPTPQPSPAAAPFAQARLEDQVSWGVAPAQNALGSGRAHFDYNADPGGTITDGLTLVNHSTRPLTLRIYASDAFTTRNGGIDVLPSGATSTDVGAWISVGTDTVTIEGGKSATVAFTLRVPANATPGDHSGGLVTSLVDTAATGGVRVEHRLGSRVYLRVSGQLSPALAVTDVHADYSGSVNPAGTGGVRITYTVKNTGNVRLSARQQITVAGPGGVLSRGTAAADLPEVLPGNSVTNTVTVHGVWPATRMTARVGLTPVAGAGIPAVRTGPVSGSATLWATPWGQLLVLLVLGAAVAGFFVVRRRQRHRVAAAISSAVAEALSRSAAQPKAESEAEKLESR
ncbi:DUF916 domain-containing protein [Dactylosporangium sp. NPDC049525]|uniref:WxL protein peptidoglycan domain-containing protein n=1 Tax=Dactylosporangium sp. NPDC049525 TaxID=3154730 RepID=UPI00344A48DD